MTLTRPHRLKTLFGAPSFTHAEADPSPRTGIDRAIELARKAEALKITGFFTADLLQADPEGLAGSTGVQDPLITLAALSQHTQHIGLVATLSTTFYDPFNIARLVGTLDHVSGGRAAWNAVTSSVGEENFGTDLPSPEARYERAREFIEILNALYDANPGSVARRTASGSVVVDPKKLGRIDYKGKYFNVAGPLNIAPLPQGRPVQWQAGQSEAGIRLGAELAEVVYTSQPTLEQAIAFVTRLRSLARAAGRVEGAPFIMNSLHSVIGESEADTARRLRERAERLDYDRGRLRLADMLGGGVDLQGLPLDRPLPASLLPELDEVNRRRGRVEIFLGFAKQGLTLRELIQRAEDTGHWHVAGTPEQIAAKVEERFNAGVVNVLTLHGLGNPDQEDLLVNGLIPELRKRNLLDDDYIEGGFRANLGLPALQDAQTWHAARTA
ncbi:NtaA/DmoA family FMN-dependent monooxygenase [Paracoccus aminophilus]|uniref:NtaA/DmoA family FMN-dependent monooxygenase n=1 Tax=Paracoccus aminophilus TaxID=34003 RepID=UPI00041F164F|nr:NtaA/DmoA family FMN-dependent monooxygenase [Paracoccus aminophilus]